MIIKDELEKLFLQYFEDSGYHIVNYNILARIIEEILGEFHDKSVMFPYKKGENYIIRENIQGLEKGDIVTITEVMNNIFEVHCAKENMSACININRRNEYLMSFEELDEWKEIISKL